MRVRMEWTDELHDACDALRDFYVGRLPQQKLAPDPLSRLIAATEFVCGEGGGISARFKPETASGCVVCFPSPRLIDVVERLQRFDGSERELVAIERACGVVRGVQ